jgi:two-component system response regulator NreC
MWVMKPIRVVLADDHAVVRTGICALLAAESVEVVAEAGNGRDLVREVRVHRPEIALVDLAMPLLNGLEATRQITKASPETRVVILSMFDDEAYVERSSRAGAWGFVRKDDAPSHLIDVVFRVARGERCLADPTGEGDERLTPRQREILQLIVEGKKSSEIARIMHRSVHTVRSHRARLMHKLGARNGAELVEAAEQIGLTRLALPRREGE